MHLKQHATMRSSLRACSTRLLIIKMEIKYGTLAIVSDIITTCQYRTDAMFNNFTHIITYI